MYSLSLNTCASTLQPRVTSTTEGYPSLSRSTEGLPERFKLARIVMTVELILNSCHTRTANTSQHLSSIIHDREGADTFPRAARGVCPRSGSWTARRRRSQSPGASERPENDAWVQARLGAPGWAGEKSDFFSTLLEYRRQDKLSLDSSIS